MPTTSKIIVVFSVLSLSACTTSYSLSLLSQDGSPGGVGTAQVIGETVTIQLNGKMFNGTYTYDGDENITSDQYGRPLGGTLVVSGSGDGRILASAPDGDRVRCDFQFQGRSGLGTCSDNAGKQYDLMIK